MKRILIISTFILSLGLTQSQAQLLALKTDALLDCAMTPNLGFELVTGEKTSLNASVFGNYKPWGLDMKMVGILPEFRYWFNGRPLVREFIGLSALGVTYDMTWGKEKYKGDAAGVGITFGYAFYLSPHWCLECHAGLGAVYYSHKHHYIEDYKVKDLYNANGYALVPYKVGVSFTYIIK